MIVFKIKRKIIVGVTLAVILSILLFTQQCFAFLYPQSRYPDFPPKTTTQASIKTLKINDHFYILEGDGGNITFNVGDDGIVIVDDGYEFMASTLLRKIREISKKPITFVINTHWHFDHTKGNFIFSQQHSHIIAQDNVLTRLEKGQYLPYWKMRVLPANLDDLPTITYRKHMSLYVNHDVVQIVHPTSCAHTDGDSVIYFTNMNLLSMGDIYFNGMYPFIDYSSHGCLNGLIQSIQFVLKKYVNDKTIIIPGHGAISNQQELKAYLALLITVRDTVKARISAGWTLAEILRSKPTASYDAAWSIPLVNSNAFVTEIYQGVQEDMNKNIRGPT